MPTEQNKTKNNTKIQTNTNSNRNFSLNEGAQLSSQPTFKKPVRQGKKEGR